MSLFNITSPILGIMSGSREETNTQHDCPGVQVLSLLEDAALRVTPFRNGNG